MPAYKGLEVFDIRPNFDRLEDDRMDDFSLDSESNGRATAWKTSTALRRRITLPFLFENKYEAKVFRKFIADRYGRLEGFWLPMYLNEFRLTQDQVATDTTISFEDVDFETKFATGNNQYQHVAIVTKDKLETYGITGMASGGGVETATLNSGLATDLTYTESIACPLLFVRLSQPSIKYRYHNHNVCECTVSFTELPTETVAGNAGSGPHSIVHTGTKPVTLHVVIFNGTTHRYTDWPVDVAASAQTYTATDISNEEIEMSMEVISEDVSVTLRTDNTTHELRAFTDRLYMRKGTWQIYETDNDSPSLPSAPLFKGTIGPVKFRESGAIEIELISLLGFSNKNFPNLPISRTSPFGVFSEHGGLSEATWQTAGTITGIDNSQSAPYIEATEISTKQTAESDTDWFSLGKVTVGNEVRVCVGSTAGRLYLNAPFREASITDAFTALPGDDKRIGTWNDKFSNLNAFLGFNLLPSDEPGIKPMETPTDQAGKK